MSLYGFLDRNIFNPLKSIPVQLYYSLKKSYNELNKEKRDYHIVVSLTSFPARFCTLHMAIKSILCQSLKPDVIFLCLTKEEVKDESELPESLTELKNYGLEIYFADNNLKPHNKYLYAMKKYPASIIITVDDDNMYDKNLIINLYKSYLKFPQAVSARRVHKITTDENNKVKSYNRWKYEYKKEKKPGYNLLATGVGGVLYPPGILPEETFNLEKIKELCLNADDIWLKFMQVKNKTSVVWAGGGRIHPLTIKRAQKITLQKSNYHENQNDKYIENLQNYYNISLASL